MNDDIDGVIDLLEVYREDVYCIALEMIEQAEKVLNNAPRPYRREAQCLYRVLQDDLHTVAAALVHEESRKWGLPNR